MVSRLEFEKCLKHRWLVTMPEARHLVGKELRVARNDYAEAQVNMAGDFNVPPAHAEEMCFPEVFGRSAGGLFSVGPAE